MSSTAARELVDIKKTTTDRFDEWRRGNYTWDPADRQAQINAVIHPRAGDYVLQDLSAPTLDILRNGRQKYRNAGYGADSLEALRARDRNQDQTVENAKRLLDERFHPVRLRHVKTLGMGGCGVAMLYSMEDRDGGVHRVVVKADIAGYSEGIKREKRFMTVSYIDTHPRTP